jgi:lipopolysaccharide/colanic/teichoic acid biosynthesis glycosyltransferase
VALRGIRILPARPRLTRSDFQRTDVAASPRMARYLAIKYAIDRVVALGAALAFAPLMAALAVAVHIDSPGPVIFRQRRIGEHGRPFVIYKFRTLHLDAPAYSLKVGPDDPCVTRLGRLLRRTALDELPQVWNIVRGEMSWVGPRPEQPFLVATYTDWERARLSVRPGLTGWWQIRRRNCEQMRDHVDLDLYYVQHVSPWLDLKIVLTTPWALWRE